MTDLREELAPCPFCGCHEINLVKHKGAGRGFDHAGDDVWTIGCNNCGASVPGCYNEHGKTLLIAAWNKRAPDPSIARVRAEERERCARVVDNLAAAQKLGPRIEVLAQHAEAHLTMAAAAIRAGV